MIWQFGELGYGFSINYPCANPCTTGTNRTAQKPIRWDYLNEARRRSLFDVTRSLIALKRFEPAFSPEGTTVSLNVGGTAMKRISLQHSTRNVVILGNFGVVSGSMNPGFSATGLWYEFFTGQAILVSNVSDPITLNRGEYRIYSNQPWMSPADYLQMLNSTSCLNPPGTDQCGNILSVKPEITQKASMEIWPNPGSGHFTLRIPYFVDGNAKVEVMDLSGRCIKRDAESIGGIIDLPLENLGLKPGVYAIRVEIAGKSYLAKAILQP
jgi:hypothetical protein